MGEFSIGLLGEPELRIAGLVVPVPGDKQRLLLTALALRVGQTVNTGELVDRLWGDRPPSTARTTLRAHMKRLRKVLSAANEGPVVDTAPGGYRLCVDPTTVDLYRFRQLIGQSRRESERSFTLKLVDEALGLWRGDALAGLNLPWVEEVRRTLEQERLAAETERIDLALACGQHEVLVAELHARTAAYPLDERAAAQLMLALYRSGRAADALAHFQRIRQRLADDLGIDPEPSLGRLHQRILTADPMLALSNGPVHAGSAEVVVPRQLPLPPRHLAGRTEELAAVDRVGFAEADAVPILVITGTGGMGKTSLALHWAHQHADRFPDGQLFVDLRGYSATEPIPPATAVRGFLEALGVHPGRVPGEIEARTALYRSVVARRRMLIVLDNARDADQVVPLLPGTPSCTVLVTSRNRLSRLVATHGAHPLPVDALPAAASRQELVHRLGAARLAAEPEAVEDLLAHCGGFPLALGILAARAQSATELPLASLADELREAATRLAAFDAGLPDVLSWSYRTLTTDQARLFALLGLAPGPDISMPAAASLVGLPPSRARTLLRALEDAHLVRQHVAGRYRMHDLVKLYAADRAADDLPADVTVAAQRRLVDFYLHTARTAERLLDNCC
jgi:DNA-binding SARP family transcriptional activator